MTYTTNIQYDSKEETFQVKCYELDGIIYVPHYKHTDAYVGPGFGKTHNNEHSAYRLEKCGAKVRYEMLWKRPRMYYLED